jgi:AraC-like DNA-binding protein
MTVPADSIRVWRIPGLAVELGHGRNVAHSFPRHWHDDFHLSLITERAGRLECRGRSYHAPAGSLSLIPPGEVHANPCDPVGCSFRNMYVDPRILLDVAAHVTGRAGSFPDFTPRLIVDSEIARAFSKLHHALEGSGVRLQQESELSAFLAHLIHRYAEQRPSPSRVGRESAAVRRTREFIAEHFAESISLAALANLTGLSPFHLNHAFCLEIGIPPHAYQIQVRITRAKAMLLRRVPISEVAFTMGFADQSHFARHFRRLTGITPAEYASRSQERSIPRS